MVEHVTLFLLLPQAGHKWDVGWHNDNITTSNTFPQHAVTNQWTWKQSFFPLRLGSPAGCCCGFITVQEFLSARWYRREHNQYM